MEPAARRLRSREEIRSSVFDRGEQRRSPEAPERLRQQTNADGQLASVATKIVSKLTKSWIAFPCGPLIARRTRLKCPPGGLRVPLLPIFGLKLALKTEISPGAFRPVSCCQKRRLEQCSHRCGSDSISDHEAADQCRGRHISQFKITDEVKSIETILNTNSTGFAIACHLSGEVAKAF